MIQIHFSASRSRPSKRITDLFALLYSAVLFVRCMPVGAQNTVPPVGSDATSVEYAAVKVEARKLFDVTGTAGFTATQRAARINRRLENIIARNEPVRPFNKEDLVSQGKETLITLGGEAVLTVTDADAQENLATREELALLWGGKMAIAVADARDVRANPLRGVGILIRNSFQDLLVSLITWLPRLAGAVILWLVFWALARIVRWSVRVTTERLKMEVNLRQLIRVLAFYGTWGVGLVAMLSTLGLESGSIATALGISGFVLGFAFKDILSHFFAGLMLLIGRQFHIGDQIVVGSFEGTVERIELRALHLRTYDNRLVIIPNGDVFTSAVVSNTASPHRRREFVIGIGYGDDIRKALQVALATMRETEGVLSDPGPDALIDELAASTVNLRLRFFVNSLRADYLRIGSEVMRRVKEAFDREGISMPTDIQTVRIENLMAVAGSVEQALRAAQRADVDEREDEPDDRNGDRTRSTAA
jgi:small conductance mechanosensitive channel